MAISSPRLISSQLYAFDGRLVTTSQDEAEVAHEALIRGWPTLHRWLEENREGLRVHRHLTAAAEEWLELDQNPDS